MSDGQPDANALFQQARWETECFRRGIERYREVAAHKQADELTSGQRLLREVLPALIVATQAAQAQGADAIRACASGGRAPLWAWPIQLLSAEQMAVITVVSALRGAVSRVSDSAEPGALTGVAQLIASGIRVQIEYDTFARDIPDVEARLRRRFPNLDKRVWPRWRKRLGVERAAKWGRAVEVALGAHLLHLLVETAPTRFAVETRRLPGARTQLFVSLSEATRRLLEDLETRAEVAMPLLRPMICAPVAWRYVMNTKEQT